MSKSSAAQHKAAPRKTVPQQTPPPASKGQPKSQSKSQSKGSSGKSYSAKGQPAAKKRGTWLTIALVAMTIGSLLSAILPFVYKKNAEIMNNPWFITAAIAVGLIGLAGVVLMWLWKRWGIYLFVISAMGSIALGLMVYPSMIVAFHEMIPLMILGAALNVDKKLPLFE